MNRSTGKAVEPGDALILLALGWLAWASTWAIGVVMGAALVLDVLLPRPNDQHRKVWLLAPAGVVIAATVMRLADVGVAAGWPGPQAAGFAAAAVVAALLMPTPASIGDVDGRPLDPLRTRLGAAVGLVFFALASGDPEAVSGYPVIGAVTALVAIVGSARLRVARGVADGELAGGAAA